MWTSSINPYKNLYFFAYSYIKKNKLINRKKNLESWVLIRIKDGQCYNSSSWLETIFVSLLFFSVVLHVWLFFLILFENNKAVGYVFKWSNSIIISIIYPFWDSQFAKPPSLPQFFTNFFLKIHQHVENWYILFCP